MSLCTPCTKAALVPLCVTNLTIGTITTFLTAVFVYQKHIGSGKVKRYDVNTGAAGEVTISPLQAMAGQDYEYSVTLATALSIETTETLTINAKTFPCVTVEYEQISDPTSGAAETYANITLNI